MSLQDESPFDRVAEGTTGRRERLLYFYDQAIRARAVILLDDWRTLIGLVIVGVYALMATVGVVVVRDPVANQVPTTWYPPFQNWAFPLGSNNLGVDLLALTVHSTPTMFLMAGAGAAFTVVLGTVVGALAGYSRGTLDTVISTFTDIMMTIPGLPLIIVISTVIVPRNPVMVGIILSINAWAALARQIRSEVLTMRQRGFVKASRTMGLSTRRILFKDIIPSLMPYITVNFVRSGRNVIFASVALYFLGILPFVNTNWGVMLNESYTSGALVTPSATHALIVPMVAIVFFTLGLTLLAQGSDRLFNPRVRVRHSKTASKTDFEER